MKRVIVCAVVGSLLLVGCGKFDVVSRPPQGLAEAPRVCIVDEPNTKTGFKIAMRNWLNQEGIQSEILPVYTPLDKCEWMLTYYGRWSWDLAIFLSDAQITAYHDATYAGEVSLKVGQWDANKFENGEKRVHKMMDLLFAKVDAYPMPKKTKSSMKK